MELHQLRYMIAVARTGNFSRAAEQCHVSQPSLSQQIQKLEDELGERLFDRLKREVKLTAHGEVFLPRAVKILDEVEAATREAKEAKDLLSGSLTIGVLPTIAPCLLPAAMEFFMTKFPGVEIIVQEDTTQQLLRLTLACELDLALVSRPIRDERLHILDLFTDELLLALPPHHKLVKKKSVSPSDLEGENLIVMKDGHCLGEQVIGFCDRTDSRTRISFRSAQLETIQSLVQAGLGISLIPAMAVPSGHGPVYRHFNDPRPERKIVAVWPLQRPLGRAGAEFLQVIPMR
jgi:LysR family hydrogen peroxide-inducible transcriptional activator